MATLKALIANSNHKTLEVFTEFLRLYDYELVGSTQYGYDCVNSVTVNTPDLVISDGYLFDCDIRTVYEQLRTEGKLGNTVFAVLSSVDDSSLINMVLDSGIDMFCLLPCDLDSLDRDIRRRALQKEKPDPDKKINDEDFERVSYIKNMLHALGVSASIQGYYLIVDAVMLAIADMSILSSMTKRLYPTLSKKYGISAQAVERAMRHAIEKSWQNGNTDLLCDVFGYTVSSRSDRPANGVYVSMLYQKVVAELKIK